MATPIDELLEQGRRLKSQGLVQPALGAYRAALAGEPDLEQSRALGEAFDELDDLADAILCYRRAAALAPQDFDAQADLADALSQGGFHDEAVRHYQRMVELMPHSAAAHTEMGGGLQRAGRMDEAVAHYFKAIDLKADAGEAEALGDAMMQLNRPSDAATCFRRAVSFAAPTVERLSKLAAVLLHLQRPEEAVDILKQATGVAPTRAGIWSDLSVAHARMHQWEQAEQAARQALHVDPGHVKAMSNLAAALSELGREQDAIAVCRRAIGIDPDSADVAHTYGSILYSNRRMEESLAFLRRTIELRPDWVTGHISYSTALLLAGDLRRGFAESEWRLKQWGQEQMLAAFGKPLWDGSTLAGKTILLHAEQGLGDTIHFCRYASILKEQGARVLMRVPPALVRLMRGAKGVDEVMGQGTAPPPFDSHLSIPSLPHVFGTTMETIPAAVPYIFVQDTMVQEWGKRLGPRRGMRVGLVWGGNPQQQSNRTRSIPLQLLAPLLEIPGVEWHSLQKGPPREELIAAPQMPIIDHAGQLEDMAETAALLMNLDMLISVDTSVAHLGGALGRPVWLMLSARADWRWLLDRSDNPWYPTLRLFRQSGLGEWEGMVARVAQALRETNR